MLLCILNCVHYHLLLLFPMLHILLGFTFYGINNIIYLSSYVQVSPDRTKTGWELNNK
jgi:hypothetical protein